MVAWVFVTVCGPSPAAWSWGHSLAVCAGFSLSRLLFLWSSVSRALAQYLWQQGVVALRHVKSFQSTDWSHGPCHWQADSYSLYHQGSPNGCRSFGVIFLEVAVEILFLFIKIFFIMEISNITENGGVVQWLLHRSIGHEMGEGIGTPLQHSCLENLIDRGAW